MPISAVAAAVGDNGCIAGSEPYIDNSFSEGEAVDTMETMIDWNRDLQPYGSNTERGYMIAEAALATKNIGPGGCNEDFYCSNKCSSPLFTYQTSPNRV